MRFCEIMYNLHVLSSNRATMNPEEFEEFLRANMLVDSGVIQEGCGAGSYSTYKSG